MITKFNFYDGVPVGVREFQEYIDGMKKSATASLIFAFFRDHEDAKNAYNEKGMVLGGFLEDAPVVLKEFPNGTSSPMYVLSGVEGVGNIFVKGGKYFDTIEVPLVKTISDIPFVELNYLASEGEVSFDTSGSITFAPKNTNNIRLPTRVGRINDSGVLESGLAEVRYNGIPQRIDPAIYDAEGRLDKLEFRTLTLGAESPAPISGTKYIPTNKPHTLSFWRTNFVKESNTTTNYFDLEFPFSNFVTDGAILVLRRVYGGKKYYLNVKQDLSSGSSIRSDSFKIVDRARGIVRLNLTENYILTLSPTDIIKNSVETVDDIEFDILCPEILVEDIVNNIVFYRTRYGGIAQATSENSQILRYSNNGSRLELIPSQKLSTSGNDVIMYEKKTKTPSTILAIEYIAEPYVNVKKQAEKYYPDLISVFFANAVSTSNKAEIKAHLIINKTSWYNWDVKKDDYSPVNRLEKANIGLILDKDIDFIIDRPVIDDPTPTIFNPTTEVTKDRVGLSEWVYVYRNKVTLGVKNEYVRRDAHIPEPHHINPPMTKTILVSDEPLTIPENEVMHAPLIYTIESGLMVEGYLLVE